MALKSARYSDPGTIPGCPCLITGATGFVGRALVATLQQKGRRVSGWSRTQSSENAGTRFGIDLAVTRRPGEWKAALVDYETVVHLANRAHAMGDELLSSIEAMRAINVHGTLNLARAAIAAGVKRFVYLSSIKVNGETTREAPFRYDDVPDPQDQYAISKHEAETGLRDLCSGSEMELVIIRPPLVYGPNVKGNLAALARWIDSGRPLPFGALENQRDLIGLNNLVDLITICIDHPNAAGQVFLCSDCRPLSTPELIRFIAGALQRPAKLWNVSPAILQAILSLAGKADTYSRLAGDLRIDMGHTRAVLDWQPPYGVEESMQWAFGPQD